jgi:predicted RNase H-like nuclease (RuvC/YqgF family)
LQTLKEDLQNKDKEIEDLREALAKAKRDPTNKEGGLYKIIAQKDAEIEELKAILPQSKVNPLLLHPRKSYGADNTLKPSINSDRDSKLDDSHLFQISKESDRYLSNTPLLHSINYDKMQKEEQKQIQQLITELSNKDTKINQLQKSIETMVKANEPQAISQSQMGEKKIESDIAKSTLTQMKSTVKSSKS